MFKRFLSLEWKQFSRSSNFQRGIAIKILLLLAVLYFGGIFLLMGSGAFYLLKELFPKQDPLVLVNNYLVFWFLIDLAIRFFMQQLPVMNIKPYMTVPIKKSTIIWYLLCKTTLSFFNFLPLFFFLPFSIVLLIHGYSPLHVVPWFFAMMFLTLSVNYLNFLLNKNNTVFYIIIALLIIFGALEYYHVYSISQPAGLFFNALYNKPYLILIPLGAMLLFFWMNYGYIKKSFYVDGAISKEVKERNTRDLSFLDRFGSLSIFLKNDVRLIMRNARPKKVLMMSFLFLFYGLIFYTNKTYKPAWLAFASMFITGGFLLSFGQLVPSWDSEYYKLLMSQNIPYRKYLESKWYLMVFAVGISFILATPYIYFGWRIYGMIAAGALFNIGLNSFITLFGGALNRVPIELNVKAKAFSNTQGFNPTQLIIALPKMLGPIIIFYIPYKLISFDAGIISLGLCGILGIVFKNFFLNKIENIYQKGKYKTIAAFNEKK